MIPIADPDVGDVAHERVQAVLDSGYLAHGEEVDGFQDEFAAFCDTDHAVATTNGTTALHAAFEALGVGDGDAVVTTPFSFVASANAVRLAGAEPVFADVEPETLTLDPAAVEAVLETRDDVAAVLPVHLYGTPAAMGPLRALADEHDVALVEDAAQAHGATYRGTRVGALGDAACFSFYPTKNMTTGEGGMITTDDPELAEHAERFCDHGRVDGYEHVELGHNFRMTNVCAAIGRAQLDRLPGFNLARRGNAAYLTEGLREASVETPTVPADRQSVFHQYTVRTDDRDALRRHLEERGVDSAVHYPTPIHRQAAYDHVSGSYPVAERAAERVLSLPVHPGLSTADLDEVIAAVRSFDRTEQPAADAPELDR